MEIRFANKNDNKTEMSKLIYGVDPYIYPYWFNGNENEAIITFSKMLSDKNSIFYYKNCIIAKEDGIIKGLLNFIPANNHPSKSYQAYDDNFESHHVIQHYILDVIDSLVPNDTCIVGLCVGPRFRRHHIALNMFKYLLNNVKSETYSLEVLADNYRAINLYKKYNFEITKTYHGYSGYRKRKPLCHIMKLTRNKKD